MIRLIDDNVKLCGKSLALIAPKVVIQDFVTCDLSGNDGVKSLNPKAANGCEMFKNGENGKDGDNGKSSGSLVICASEITNPENLNVILNGGDGSNGQDGGNGLNGKNGVGKKFKKAFGFGTKLKLKTAVIGNIILGGLPGILRARYNESQANATDIKRLKVFSTHKWSSHSMIVYQGTAGSPGGHGGLNGRGGYGGKKGNLTILNVSNADIPIKVESNDGKNGKDGEHGKDGIDGHDGWDVACIKKSFGRLRKYGKFNNEKLKIIITDKEDKDTVYVKSKDVGRGSQCYAKIVVKPLKHSTLKENEQLEVLERTERVSAPEANKVNLNSISKSFQKLCLSSSAINKTEHVMQVGRKYALQVFGIIVH
uniref:Uncharacterized protein n=1 Tax=Panagrolaimus davidi TaxID=227884 RepID=A0A914P2V6_9BILA